VLTAFQNVADLLHPIQRDAEVLKATLANKDAAGVTLDLVQLQYRSGYANYLSMLNAEQMYQQTLISLV